MNNEKENDSTKKYLRKVHGRIKVCMFCLDDSKMYIITKCQIGSKKKPKSFYHMSIVHELLDFKAVSYEERKSHNILSPNGRIR